MLDATFLKLSANLKVPPGWRSKDENTMTTDLESRLLGMHAAVQYCALQNIDPDDITLRRWNEGLLTDALLLHWKSESLERESAREIAVSVARAACRLCNYADPKIATESPLFHDFSEIVGERVAGIISATQFQTKAEALLSSA